MLLSIIIPSKNEESNLERCLASLAAHNPLGPQSETILVDCASSDSTVDRARRHPVKILQLHPDWPHTPAAARFIGARFASGEFILFIDADMTLEPGFIGQALEHIRSDESIAAVGGIGNETYVREGIETGQKKNLYLTGKTVANVRFIGGAGLYRRMSLLEAGGFNPYLKAAEEFELASRLRKKGFQLVSLPIPMITHYTAPLSLWEEFLRKKRAGFFFGIGQAIRATRDARFLAEALMYYRQFSLFLAYLGYCAAVAAYAIARETLGYALLTLVPPAVICISLCVKKKSLPAACAALFKWVLISCDILAGLIKGSADPTTYPRKPTVIQGEFHV